MYLQSNLRFLRKSRGYNQSDFGAFIDIKGENISNYERGNTLPSIITIAKVAAFFEVTIDTLVNKDLSNQGNISNRVEEPFIPYGKSNCKNELEMCQLKLEHSQSKVELLQRHVEVLEKYIEKIENK